MPEISPSRYLVQAGWDHVPHLDEKTKAELLASTLPHLRDARSKGTPSLGAGAIYPVQESTISTPPFAIPDYWPRAYAMDVGWNRTACLWGAWDPADGSMTCYSEHYLGEALPSTHAVSVRARGDWMRGVIDPAANGRGQKDGEQLMQDYRGLGLKLTKASNAVEAGLISVLQGLSTGRIKVFSTLVNFWDEFRLYRRDEKGRIVKENDHLMDCLRYLWMSGKAVSMTKPMAEHLTRSGQGFAADKRAGY